VNKSKNVNIMKKKEKKQPMELVEPDRDAGSSRNARREEPGEEIARPAYHESIEGYRGHAHPTRKERHMERMSTLADLPLMGEIPLHIPGTGSGKDMDGTTGHHRPDSSQDTEGTKGREYFGHRKDTNGTTGHHHPYHTRDSQGTSGHETGHHGQDEYTVSARAGVPV